MSHPVRVHLISLSLVLGLTVSLVWGQAPPSPVFLSLSGTTITTNNTEVLITDIGQDDHTSLTCHTDLTTCCRGSDGDAAGEWYYPDGTVVPNRAGTDNFARLKNAPQVARLYRRIPPAATSPTGLYCCVIPTTIGEQTFCANLKGSVYLSLSETNITTNNTEVLITDIGQDDPDGLPSLTCHIDLTTCCRGSDGVTAGEWYYPDGTVVPNNAGTNDFARVNNAPQAITLYRRIPPGATSPTGLYCCVINTTFGKQTFCANLVVCKFLTPPTNGTVTYNPPESPGGLGTIATYSCNQLYVLVGGTHTRTCLAEGSWNGSVPTCKFHCDYLTPPTNGTVTYNPPEFPNGLGTIVTYSCNQEYVLVGGIPTRTCLAEGSWSGSVPTCEFVICPILIALADGTITYIPTIMGTLAFYHCDIGYSLNGLIIRTCGSNGVWSAEAPICEAVVCGQPPSISNGSPGTPTNALLGETVTYTCNNGYIPVGPVEISCLANGQWETPPMCAPPPVYFSLSSTNYVTNNSEILLSSLGEDPGNYLTCHTDVTNCCRASDTGLEGGVGAWHYPNGSVIQSINDGDGDIYSNRDAAMVIRLNRRPGVAGPTGLYCCVIPTSTGTYVSCVNLVSVICPILTALANGTIAYIPTIMGTLAFYQCDVGYGLNGLAIRTCGSNAVWSGEEPTCEAVVCGPPPSISNGSPGTTTTTLLGGTVTYTCNNGYILVGPVEISCLANGQWETPPMCAPPPVYFSLSSTNYITNNSEILLSSVGEDPGNYLTCHTDVTNCCRNSDTGVESGVGVWHYPNGSVIPTVRNGGGDIYIKRDAAMVIRLNRRPGVPGPTGLYCCVIPTSTGTDVSCVNLVSGSPNINTGAIVGGVVVILGLALILASAVIITYLVLKQRRIGEVNLKRTSEIPLSHLGQSSPSQMFESVEDTYEEIGKPCPPDGQLEYTQCHSYVNISRSSRKEGVVDVEGGASPQKKLK